jgi:asparagine synthase (glutamine-hydrolysing)
MCGVAGFLFNSTTNKDEALSHVKLMTDRMAARGPDAEALYTDEGIVLGHRRLAILDLDPRSNQPMTSSCGRYIIVFNGEIYNYKDLRHELQTEGVNFRTTSDTEVLLTMFAREGELMLPKLRGMFAFAVWDILARELFMARDPYGIKPLYYSQTTQGLVFASQFKALLASGLIARDLEPAGLAGFYLWGSVPEPWTLYRNVFALPAGHWLRVSNGIMTAPLCWHDIRKHWRSNSIQLPAPELQERVQQAVRASVQAHLVADVPVIVFLSGGIDSGALAGLAVELGAQVEGITLGFEEFAGQHHDEVPVVRAIAAHYGLPHHVRTINRVEFEQDLPSILDAMDQPSVDGVNTWFASKAVAERGYKVVLSGVGGDELFCGYPSFKSLPHRASLGKIISTLPAVSGLLTAPCSYFSKHYKKPKLAGMPTYMGSVEGQYFLQRALFLPTELPILMGIEQANVGLARLAGSPPGMSFAEARDGGAAIGLLESTHYLRNQLIRDSDWASMGHSLELRTPLVDATLLETLGPCVTAFAGGKGKSMLARSPKKPLPASVINRPKTGFGLPIEKWLLDATDKSAWANLPMLATTGTPWARRWAKTIMKQIIDHDL